MFGQLFLVGGTSVILSAIHQISKQKRYIWIKQTANHSLPWLMTVLRYSFQHDSIWLEVLIGERYDFWSKKATSDPKRSEFLEPQVQADVIDHLENPFFSWKSFAVLFVNEALNLTWCGLEWQKDRMKWCNLPMLFMWSHFFCSTESRSSLLNDCVLLIFCFWDVFLGVCCIDWTNLMGSLDLVGLLGKDIKLYIEPLPYYRPASFRFHFLDFNFLLSYKYDVSSPIAGCKWLVTNRNYMC